MNDPTNDTTPMTAAEQAMADTAAARTGRVPTGRTTAHRQPVSAEAQDLMARVGQQITDERTHLDLSLATVAERAGIDAPALSKITKGQRVPTIVMLHRIADALGCDLVVQLKPRTKRSK